MFAGILFSPYLNLVIGEGLEPSVEIVSAAREAVDQEPLGISTDDGFFQQGYHGRRRYEQSIPALSCAV